MDVIYCRDAGFFLYFILQDVKLVAVELDGIIQVSLHDK